MEQAAAVGYPPAPPTLRPWPRPLPGWPCDFQPPGSACNSMSTLRLRAPLDETSDVAGHLDVSRSLSLGHPEISSRQDAGQQLGMPGRDLLYPKYSIHNYAAYLPTWNGAEGGLSNHTVNTDVIHQNGLAMYDTHNLYVSNSLLCAERTRTRILCISTGL